jgi:hypothetical protein
MSACRIASARRSIAGALVIAAAIAVVASRPLTAQVPVADLNITPVYEGWIPNADGTFDLVFGYVNRQWDEEVTVPLGPANMMEPGQIDMGQPTHFLPKSAGTWTVKT